MVQNAVMVVLDSVFEWILERKCKILKNALISRSQMAEVAPATDSQGQMENCLVLAHLLEVAMAYVVGFGAWLGGQLLLPFFFSSACPVFVYA
jgi:hypothetical protein